tara:strand:- start:10861 stop:11394 length:534 start_codon:yes stop_codon:yes gene_type:complete
MNTKGFFGAIVLLLAVEALLLFNSAENGIFVQHNSTESKLIAIGKTGFERTEAELFLDKAIEHSFETNVSNPVDAETIKLKINLEIIKAFKELGLENTGICKENFLGKEIKVKNLNIENLTTITSASAIPKGEFTIIQYTISGGINYDLFPCAKIFNGNFSNYFRIPINYSITRVVV